MNWFRFYCLFVENSVDVCPPTYTRVHIERGDWRQKCVNASVNQFLSRNIRAPKILLGYARWRGTMSPKHQAFSYKYAKTFKLNNENYYVSVHTFHSCCAMPNEMKHKRPCTNVMQQKRQQPKLYTFANNERQY